MTTAIVAWVVSVPIRLGFGESLGDFYMGETFLPDSLRYLLRALYANDFVDILTSLVFQIVADGLELGDGLVELRANRSAVVAPIMKPPCG